MTNKEAIEILQNEIDSDIFVATEYRKKIHEALSLGIEALEERPQGKWICNFRSCTCSVCNFTTVIDTYNFCPNCGADMRGGEEE